MFDRMTWLNEPVRWTAGRESLSVASAPETELLAENPLRLHPRQRTLPFTVRSSATHSHRDPFRRLPHPL